MQELLIDSIRTDGTQSRAALNREYVAELVELITAGTKLPPVVVYRDGKETWMADGFHRLAAHVEAKKRTIRAEVHKGSKADARWHSIGANLSHGLRRTNADKRHAVEMALQDRPGASDKLIANHCGVTDRFVWQVRHQRQPQNGSEVRKRIGVDGVTRRLPPPPPPPQGVMTISPPVPRPPPGELDDNSPVAQSGHERDLVGSVIPDHLHELFSRGEEIARLVKMLQEIRLSISKATEDDPLWLECDRQQIEALLSQAVTNLKATIPYAVCPWCRGQVMKSDCRGCNGRGLIGKFRYDTAVPSELKP